MGDSGLTEKEVEDKINTEKRLSSLEVEVERLAARLDSVETEQTKTAAALVQHDNDQKLEKKDLDSALLTVAKAISDHTAWHERQDKERGKGFYKFRDVLGVVSTSLTVLMFLVMAVATVAIFANKVSVLDAQQTPTKQTQGAHP